MITKPICDNRSILLVNKGFVNTSKLRESRSSGIKVSPLVALSIYY
jgi:hypothetical protein